MIIEQLLEGYRERVGEEQSLVTARKGLEVELNKTSSTAIPFWNGGGFGRVRAFNFTVDDEDYPQYFRDDEEVVGKVTMKARCRKREEIGRNDVLEMQVELGGRELLYILREKIEESEVILLDEEGRIISEDNFTEENGKEIAEVLKWLSHPRQNIAEKR